MRLVIEECVSPDGGAVTIGKNWIRKLPRVNTYGEALSPGIKLELQSFQRNQS